MWSVFSPPPVEDSGDEVTGHHDAQQPSSQKGQQNHHSLDAFLSAFPVPGEQWTHLFAMTNYYSALLNNHPPPLPGEPP